MTRYASKTNVSADRTRNEIESLLARNGADQFAYAAFRDKAIVGFVLHGRMIKIAVPLPDPQADDFTRTPGRGKLRNPDEARKLWEQGCRARWRAVLLVLRAKLEAVAIGVTTIESEFLAFTVLPGGETVMEHIGDGIALAIENGKTPRALLPEFTR